MKLTNKYGYSLLDIIFVIVMPALIISAAIVALREPTYNRPAITEERLSYSVDPDVSRFWSINTQEEYGSGEVLFYLDSKTGGTVYSTTNVSQKLFYVDVSRPNPHIEFFEKLDEVMKDSGFLLDNGRLPTTDIEDSIAASFINKNANRRCTVVKLISKNISLTCADVDYKFTSEIQKNIEEFKEDIPEGKVYYHKEFSSTYYGSEPRDNSDYEYSLGKTYNVSFITEVPVIDEASEEAALFWRLPGEQWTLFIDTDFDKSEVEINCAEISSVMAPALPNYVCLDDRGQYKFLGDYYAE